jgi:hypothetical protein
MSARGTTNRNDRGSTRDRRARKVWLLSAAAGFGGDGETVPCYRCTTPCTIETLTADRRLAGVLGGTYRRENLRPACLRCNSVTGTELRELIRRGVLFVPGRQAVAA